MSTERPSLFAIVGPTASGKSALAMALAQRIGGEILSADSMQVYRGMDIGTAKPSEDERHRVRHHLLDVVEAHEQFTTARFVELADAVIHDAAERGVPLVVVGGTPLYYKALFEGLFAGPSADLNLRQQLHQQSSEALHSRLVDVDPASARRIHINDRKRVIRALEVYELTGRPISDHQSQWDSGRRYRARWIGLQWERDQLNRRINARVKAMIESGWLEEVRRLLSAPGGLSVTASEATGYAELSAHLRGEIGLDEAAEQIKIATRQLARRQMKWLRRFPDVQWIDGVRAAFALAEGTPKADTEAFWSEILPFGG
jgi:tRNA dimethylallyltransferase